MKRRGTWGEAVAVVLILGASLTACATDESPFTVSGLGDCEKPTKDAAVPASPHFWDAAGRRLMLHGGRNEMVAAQLVLSVTNGDVRGVNVEIGDLKGPTTIPASGNISLFREVYHKVTYGNWYGFSDVLPSGKWYPEVLAPFTDPYAEGVKPVGAPFDILVTNGPNQGVWIDVYIPKDAKPGKYEAPVRISVSNAVRATATLEVKVRDYTLPDEAHVDGYGEFYGAPYIYHGAVYKEVGADKWWAVAKRYHQMAHQHRFVIMERRGRGPDERKWADYKKTYGSVLDGSAFTAAQGYVGPGAGTGPTFWRGPFGQDFDGKVPNFSESQLENYANVAKSFRDQCKTNGWDRKRLFAYIIDEPGRITARTVVDMKRLQDALDAGAGPGRIALMWTSHTDPSTLVADPATDLRGVIRWWSPNGLACNPGFLAPRAKIGETVWFYHHGHPAIGVHAVNATGIELRTWGAICWRYQLNGSFWWAMDSYDEKNPMTRPVYNTSDSRWGNGVLFYCGARLPDLGMPAIAGPVSCLRMKAYRRGLQDYEYGWLLRQAGKGAVADEAFKRLIPVALSEGKPKEEVAPAGAASEAVDRGQKAARTGTFKAPWVTDVNAWYQAREELASALEAK